MRSATELHQQGLQHSHAGRHAAARQLYLRALERTTDPDELARIQLSLAYVQSELGTAAEGLELCARALENRGISSHVRGLIHSQQGMLQMRSGHGVAALAAFDKAVRLLDSTPEPQATAFLNRGNVFVHRGDVRHAMDDFRDAASQFELAGLPMDKAKAEHNLGCAYLLAGDLVTALTLMDGVRRVIGGTSPVIDAVIEQDRADVLIAAGMLRDAEAALRAAAKAYGSRGLRQRQAEAELALSRVLLREEEPSEAGRVARRAARRFRARGSESWALRADIIWLASGLGRRGGTGPPDADTLQQSLHKHGLRQDAQVVALLASSADLRRGDLTAAQRRLRGIRLGANAPLPDRLLDRETRADFAAAQGRRRAAMQHVRTGLAQLHDWQSSFGSLDLQSSLVGHGRGLAMRGLSLAVADGRPEVVFEWSERARALTGRVAPVRPPADSTAADDLVQLRNTQREISSAELTGKVPVTLTRKAAELRGRIRQRAWYDEGSGVVVEPAGLDDVRDALAGTQDTLASYIFADGGMRAVLVTAERCDVVQLGRYAPIGSLLRGMQADLDMAATHLPAAMRLSVQSALQHRLARLDDHLVAPLAKLLGGGRLVVAPSAYLAGTPWTMLPGFAGRPLTVPRSASSWLMARRTDVPHASAGFVAGPGVDRAHEEVKRASEAWHEARMLAGEEVNAAAVSALAGNVDIFHVAAHGRHSADNPLFSGLELADGPWFGYDIDQLSSIPSTVILSACELGRSSVRWGEETIGMTVAWQHAGARCVIASPASVDDDVACEVLAATHARLAAGEPPADALADASVATSDSLPAPFICFGAGW